MSVVERRSADPNAIRFVDMAIAGDGLDSPAGPCRPSLTRQATGSTLGQRKYLPNCRTRGFPHQITLSRSSQSGFWCGRQRAEHPDPREFACYLRSWGTSKVNTWIATPVASGHGSGQRTSTRGTLIPSWGGLAAYIEDSVSDGEITSCSGGDPACLSCERSSF